MKKNTLFLVLCIALSSCASAPEPRVAYVDPGAQGRVAGTGIESQDIAAAAQKAAASIVNLPAIARASQPPIVLITPVKNNSSVPIDTDLYTTKLRGTLMEHGSGKVRFLARNVSESVNDEEQARRESGKVRSRGEGKSRVGETYDYILTAELQGISASNSEGQSDYTLVSFKLVDYQDMLVWESQYEIKKEGRESAIYR